MSLHCWQLFLLTAELQKALLRYDGPLGGFVTRTDLAYSLGLIPKGVLQNLRTLAEIRNQFAHSYLSLTFDDADVAALCFQLTLLRMYTKKRHSETGKETLVHQPWNESFRNVPRLRYVIVASLLAMHLLDAGRTVERRIKDETGWTPDDAPPDDSAI